MQMMSLGRDLHHNHNDSRARLRAPFVASDQSQGTLPGTQLFQIMQGLACKKIIDERAEWNIAIVRKTPQRPMRSLQRKLLVRHLTAARSENSSKDTGSRKRRVIGWARELPAELSYISIASLEHFRAASLSSAARPQSFHGRHFQWLVLI